MEVSIAFQLQTGYNVISSKADLDNQVSCFRAAFTKLGQHKKSSIRINGKKSNYRIVLRPTRCIQTNPAITGVPGDGIHRRPIWNTKDTKVIANNIQQHHERACTIAADATETWRCDYRASYHKDRPKWTPHEPTETPRGSQRVENDSKRAPKWCQNGAQRVPKTVPKQCPQPENLIF